jgi:hypothetical protein
VDALPNPVVVPRLLNMKQSMKWLTKTTFFLK